MKRKIQLILLIFILCIHCELAQAQQYDNNVTSVTIVEEIDSDFMQKAIIEKDGTIWLLVNTRKEHRIFGYKDKDINSEKMILLSTFTNEVENNPFGCKYGAFYDTYGMKDKNIELKYITTENEFLKIDIIQNRKTIDQVYMLKKWFEFEK